MKNLDKFTESKDLPVVDRFTYSGGILAKESNVDSQPVILMINYISLTVDN